MQPLVLVLLVAEVLTLAALGVVTWQLVRTRREADELQRRIITRSGSGSLPAPTRVRQAAGWAVRTAFDTADRVRERGLISGLLMAPIEDLTRWAVEDRAEIAAVAGPDGTLAFMFSDIEGSTRLNEQLGDKGWVRVLSAHDKVVRSQVSKHNGHVVKSQGDGFMLVFGHPSDALDAALRIQDTVGRAGRHLRRTPVRLRIGIHVGTAVARDGDYFGSNVAKAARVAAVAEGGQVLVSDEAREALELGAQVGAQGGAQGVSLRPAGEHELKGLGGTHVLWTVES